MNTANNTSSPLKKPSSKMCIASWAAVVVMAAIIFWMSANTGTEINQGLGILSAIKAFLADAAYALAGHEVDVSPIGHFVEYFLLGITLLNALRFHIPLSRALLFAVVIGSAYGVTDEIHQIFVPDRSCDPADWAVDTLAVFIGALLTKLALKTKTNQ